MKSEQSPPFGLSSTGTSGAWIIVHRSIALPHYHKRMRCGANVSSREGSRHSVFARSQGCSRNVRALFISRLSPRNACDCLWLPLDDLVVMDSPHQKITAGAQWKSASRNVDRLRGRSDEVHVTTAAVLWQASQFHTHSPSYCITHIWASTLA